VRHAEGTESRLPIDPVEDRLPRIEDRKFTLQRINFLETAVPQAYFKLESLILSR